MKLKFLLLLSGCYFISNAQNVKNEVFSSGGNYFSTPANQLTYTIGEVIVPTFKQRNNSLTQGFNQPSNLIVSAVQNVNAAFTLNTYPNPTQDLVNIDITGQLTAPLIVEMYNEQGAIVNPDILQNDESRIRFNMQDFASGFYSVRLINKADNSFSTVKIVKID